jgi:hypothetical protein
MDKVKQFVETESVNLMVFSWIAQKIYIIGQ